MDWVTLGHSLSAFLHACVCKLLGVVVGVICMCLCVNVTLSSYFQKGLRCQYATLTGSSDNVEHLPVSRS